MLSAGDTGPERHRAPKTGETPASSPKHTSIKITHRLFSNDISRGSERKQLHHLLSLTHTHSQVFTSIGLHRRFLLQLQTEKPQKQIPTKYRQVLLAVGPYVNLPAGQLCSIIHMKGCFKPPLPTCSSFKSQQLPPQHRQLKSHLSSPRLKINSTFVGDNPPLPTRCLHWLRSVGILPFVPPTGHIYLPGFLSLAY